MSAPEWHNGRALDEPSVGPHRPQLDIRKLHPDLPLAVEYRCKHCNVPVAVVHLARNLAGEHGIDGGTKTWHGALTWCRANVEGEQFRKRSGLRPLAGGGYTTVHAPVEAVQDTSLPFWCWKCRQTHHTPMSEVRFHLNQVGETGKSGKIVRLG